MAEDAARILVVDDNEDNRFTLTRRLGRQGFEQVETAADGREALDKLAGGAFDLVLLDIMMPGMNGYQVLEQMKADMALRHIPVIMISAIDEMDSVVRCIELGAEDYLGKPFNRVLLKARIDACLEKKRLRDQEAAFVQRVERERKRADAILHAMLPAAAVQELKASNQVRPRRAEDVAVLFCDVVGFTAYCDEHSAEEVVAHLQALVDRFEQVAEAHGLEKIKTIGDAFMAAAGLLRHVEEPVLAALRCGLAMVEAAGEMESGWQVRVGVHAGPVIAGVIGQRQYAYDVWGDTVNVAARVVDQAAPGTVLVTAPAFMEVQSLCRGRSAGFVELKGKGRVELIECRAAAEEAAS